MNLARRALSILISLTLGFNPIAHARDSAAAPEVNPYEMISAQQTIEEQLGGLSRMQKSKSKLNTAYSAAVASGGFFVREIMQLTSTLIVLGAINYKAKKDRDEMDRLSGGTYKAPVAYDPNAKLCAQKEGADPNNDVFCSGEFVIGMVSGAAGFLPAGPVMLISHWVTKGGARLPFVRLVLGLFSTGLMLSLSQLSTFLWTQAVKLLPEQEKVDRSKGVAGRASIALASGRWGEFWNSADGALLMEIGEIMYKIAYSEEKLRKQWLYNTWRFGMRGEFMASMASIMASTATFQPLKMTTKLIAKNLKPHAYKTAAFTARTATFWGYVVGITLGVVGLTYVLESSFPKVLTQTTQGSRKWLASAQMGMNSHFMTVLAERFHVTKYPRADEPVHRARVLTAVNEFIEDREKLRQDWINIAIEKYVELKLEIEVLQQKIKVAEKVVSDPELRKQMYIEANGELIPYEVASRTICDEHELAPVGYPLMDNFVAPPKQIGCVPSAEFQKKAVAELNGLIADAKNVLREIALAMVEFYKGEIDAHRQITDNTEIILPFEIGKRLSTERRRAEILSWNFMGLTAIFDSDLARTWEIPPLQNPEEIKEKQKQARATWDAYYGFGFEERVVYQTVLTVLMKNRPLATPDEGDESGQTD